MVNQFLSLSLFLMLLSFFIVLNAASDVEAEKSKPVLNSIYLAFSNGLEKEVLLRPAPAPNPRAVEREGDTLAEIEGVFNSHIATFEISKNKLGTQMRVRIPIWEFESAIDMYEEDFENVGVGERGSFAKTLASLVRSKTWGAEYRIDMSLNIDEDPAVFAQDDPEGFRKETKRLSSYAERFERAGLPKKMTSIALMQGKRGYIDLHFQRYKPFDIAAEIKRRKAL